MTNSYQLYQITRHHILKDGHLHGKSSCSVKSREFLDQLSDYQRLRKDSASGVNLVG
jgi:hypothetical protein